MEKKPYLNEENLEEIVKEIYFDFSFVRNKKLKQKKRWQKKSFFSFHQLSYWLK